uniref:Uncharacterized protein n=1 Tax=Oryza brachyantha TaxID=4533 RepID=J3MX00_ORYBR
MVRCRAAARPRDRSRRTWVATSRGRWGRRGSCCWLRPAASGGARRASAGRRRRLPAAPRGVAAAAAVPVVAVALALALALATPMLDEDGVDVEGDDDVKGGNEEAAAGSFCAKGRSR